MGRQGMYSPRGDDVVAVIDASTRSQRSRKVAEREHCC